MKDFGIRRDARGVYRHQGGRPVHPTTQRALTAAAPRPAVSRPAPAQKAAAQRARAGLARRLAAEMDAALAASYVRDIDATFAADRARQVRTLTCELDAALGRRRRRPGRAGR